MHKLDRDPAAPACLAKYQHGRDQWTINSPDGPERQQIWAKLGTMQGWRCAYCEADISGNTPRHIEHFRQRDRHPQGTFDWDNLFGSCNRLGTCGDHKDKCGVYPHQVLIKPDIDGPEDFLVFSADGSVRARAGLSPAELKRAQETIRILNLNGALRQIRCAEVAGYVQIAEYFAELAQELPEADWMPAFLQEVRNISHLPYATAIRHVLTRQDQEN